MNGVTRPPLFDRLANHFAGICGARPELIQVDDFCVAGARVRFLFAGPSLAQRMGSTLAHLRLPDTGSWRTAASEAPDLTLCLWDDSATGLRTPDDDFGEPDLTVVERAQGGNLLTARGGGLLIHWTPHGQTLLDLRSGRGYGWIDRADSLSQAQAAKPLLPLLFPWLVARGLYPIHAGCVARGPRGLILAGPGGVGKSTSSLAAAMAGMDFLGDDYLALEDSCTGGFIAHSLYGAAWLDKTHSQRLPTVAARPLAEDEPAYAKRPFDTARALPGRLSRTTLVTALLLPRLTNRASTGLRPASKAQALGRVGADALLRGQWFAPRGQALPLWTRLIARVPCFWLEMGRDLDQLGRVIAEGFDGISGC